nr:hypothetical protein Z952_p0029 [Clostridium botulinum C/D str. BKT75002]KEI05184.1 hypothetical protein Z954_0029 [Clostridium botulinum C/D str. BKT2873]
MTKYKKRNKIKNVGGNFMEYYELIIQSYLKQNMHYKGVPEYLGSLINYCMLRDEKLEKLHNAKGLKGYVFNTLTPFEKDGMYKQNNIYQFSIRSINLDILKRIQNAIKNINNDEMASVNTTLTTWHQKYMESLYTYTPSVLTLKEDEVPEKLKKIKSSSKYWVNGCSNKVLVDRIEKNMIKKYNFFTGNNIENISVVSDIQVLNEYPILIKYKKANVMANKFLIKIENSKLAQDIAFITLATGLLEKSSSIGCGFCQGNYYKEVMER